MTWHWLCPQGGPSLGMKFPAVHPLIFPLCVCCGGASTAGPCPPACGDHRSLLSSVPLSGALRVPLLLSALPPLTPASLPSTQPPVAPAVAHDRTPAQGESQELLFQAEFESSTENCRLSVSVCFCCSNKTTKEWEAYKQICLHSSGG